MPIRVESAGTGGGGTTGDSTYTDTYANIPAASNDGDLFLPSDGISTYRDTGVAWIPWGPHFPFTEPVSGDFSWVNQGGASIDATYGGVYILAPAVAGANVRARVKAAPATPYTITAWILPHLKAYDYNGCGLLFRQSSTQELATFSLVHDSDWGLDVAKYTDATTYSAQYTRLEINQDSLICLRIADDGASRICSWSMDGQHFFQVHSVGRTDFLTADQVGFYAQPLNATHSCAMTLLSWSEA